MSNFTALYDACVLYPMPLCDLLLELALTGTFRARWSDAIHEEWICTAKNKRPDISDALLARKRRAMDNAIKNSLVKNYEQLVPGLELPDAKDRHVLAAAISAHADVIVTYNLKDFPIEALAPWGVEAQHPDEFVANLLNLYPGAVCWAVKLVRARLAKPPYTLDEYLSNLKTVGLTKTVAGLADYAGAL